MRLEGDVALVTGAAMGMGEAIARLFAREGAHVILADVNAEKGEGVAEEIRREGGSALFVETDVASSEQMKRTVATAVSRFGKLTIAILNAGIDVVGTVVDISEDDWWRCLRVNLGGVFLGMKHAIPAILAAGGGSVVSISSIQGLVGFPAYSAYAASKGGIIALTKQVAVDYGPRGVRVNTICPSTVLTPMCDRELREAEDPDALLREWAEPHPLKRIGQPVDVAEAALFLASRQASWVTGHVFVLDGGVTATGF